MKLLSEKKDIDIINIDSKSKKKKNIDSFDGIYKFHYQMEIKN